MPKTLEQVRPLSQSERRGLRNSPYPWNLYYVDLHIMSFENSGQTTIIASTVLTSLFVFGNLTELQFVPPCHFGSDDATLELRGPSYKFYI